MTTTRSATKTPGRGGRREAAYDWRLLVLLGGIGALMIVAGMAATGSGSLGGAPAGPPAVTVDLSVETATIDGQKAYILVLGAMLADQQEAVLTFRTGQTYDFIVVQNGQEIWRWSHGRAFHQAVQQPRWRPGELVIFTAVWDGRDAAGQKVTGPVQVQAVLTADPPVTTGAVSLELD